MRMQALAPHRWFRTSTRRYNRLASTFVPLMLRLEHDSMNFIEMLLISSYLLMFPDHCQSSPIQLHPHSPFETDNQSFWMWNYIFSRLILLLLFFLLWTLNVQYLRSETRFLGSLMDCCTAGILTCQSRKLKRTSIRGVHAGACWCMLVDRHSYWYT